LISIWREGGSLFSNDIYRKKPGKDEITILDEYIFRGKNAYNVVNYIFYDVNHGCQERSAILSYQSKLIIINYLLFISNLINDELIAYYSLYGRVCFRPVMGHKSPIDYRILDCYNNLFIPYSLLDYVVGSRSSIILI